MKKIFLAGLVIALFSISSLSVFACSKFSEELQQKFGESVILFIGNSTAFVDCNETMVDTTNPEVYPFIKDERTLVPVRFISEGMGAQVDWYEDEQKVEIVFDNEHISFTIGSNNMSVISYDSGQEIGSVTLDVPAQIINERTFIPLRALVEALGKNVFWDDRGLIVISDAEYDAIKDKTLIDQLVAKFEGNDVEVNIEGNSTGNISNWGYVTKQDQWIYYVKGINGAIYKINSNNENIKVSDDGAAFINVIGDWIYYTNWSDNGNLYKIKTDGTSKTKLSNHGADWINAVGDWLYFSYQNYDNSSDKGLCKIKTDGTGETLIASGDIYFVNVYDNAVYYEDFEKGLCKINCDGTNQTVIDENCDGLYGVCDGWVYYSKGTKGDGSSSGIYKRKTDGTNETTVINDELYEANVNDGWIYYSNGNDNFNLYKIRTDGTGKVKIADNEEFGYLGNISIAGDWIYYQPGIEEESDSSYYRIKTDGTQKEIVADMSVSGN